MSEQLFRCVISNIKWNRDELMKPNSVEDAMATGNLILKVSLPRTVRFWTTEETYDDEDFILGVLADTWGVSVKGDYEGFDFTFEEVRNNRMLQKVKRPDPCGIIGHFYME